MELSELLKETAEAHASDLFLKTGGKPCIRVDSRVMPLRDEFINREIAEEVFHQITDDDAKLRFYNEREVDISYHDPEIGRFRVNIFRQSTELSFVFRLVQASVPSFIELNLPLEGMEKVTSLSRGLVLVTGVAGSGKSTTIASAIQHINNTRHMHIVTIEDPIEYIFSDNKSIINQREIGSDTESFSSALKHVVRQSPDIIVIGEMRDRDTVATALAAAESGHLVFSTLHTINATQTVERIMSFFPPHQHELIRLQMSLFLQSVVCQRLIPRSDGPGRVPAVEMLFATPYIKDLLVNGQTVEISKALAKERSHYGTQTFNQALADLYRCEAINLEDAKASADSPDELMQEIRGIRKGHISSDAEMTKDYVK